MDDWVGCENALEDGGGCIEEEWVGLEAAKIWYLVSLVLIGVSCLSFGIALNHGLPEGESNKLEQLVSGEKEEGLDLIARSKGAEVYVADKPYKEIGKLVKYLHVNEMIIKFNGNRMNLTIHNPLENEYDLEIKVLVVVDDVVVTLYEIDQLQPGCMVGDVEATRWLPPGKYKSEIKYTPRIDGMMMEDGGCSKVSFTDYLDIIVENLNFL